MSKIEEIFYSGWSNEGQKDFVKVLYGSNSKFSEVKIGNRKLCG